MDTVNFYYHLACSMRVNLGRCLYKEILGSSVILCLVLPRWCAHHLRWPIITVIINLCHCCTGFGICFCAMLYTGLWCALYSNPMGNLSGLITNRVWVWVCFDAHGQGRGRRVDPFNITARFSPTFPKIYSS